jgi:hypothetical protein
MRSESEPQGEKALQDRNILEHRIAREVHLSRRPIVRIGLVVLGSLFVGLGFLGILLPLLPTTPFFLLAAACYARGSERFYVWLLTNRMFGESIRDWRDNKGIPYRTKVWITVVLLGTLGATGFFFVPVVPVQILLAAVGIGVSYYIWRLPTKRVLAQEN